MVAELDLESVLAQVLDAARDLTGASYAALGILDEHKERLGRFLTVGIDDEARRRIGPLPQGRGVLGELIRDPKPLRLSNVSQHPHSYGFPAGHPPMATFLGVPVSIRGEVFGNLYLTDKEGGEEFSDVDEELLIVLAGWASVAIDNARLYEGAEQRRAELERAVHGLEATASLGLELGGETNLEIILELVVNRGRAVVGARVFLVLLRGAGDRLVVAHAAGELPTDLRDSSLRIEAGSALADALLEGETKRLDDADPVSEAELGVPHSQLLVTPLAFRGETQGLLVAFDTAGGKSFSADDALVLRSFAASAATAIATSRSVERQSLRLTIEASERERRRWAMELHDETLQELGAMKLMHENALQRDDAETTRQTMQCTVDQLESAIGTLEALITELRPAVLDDLGVRPALEALVKRLTEANDIAAGTDIDLAYDRGREAPRLAHELEATIYRVVQEALNNIVKHAEASTVKVSVVENSESVRISVEDDGRGFSPDPNSERFGLTGMKERVSLSGGEFELESEPGKGTRIRARLPVARVGSGGPER